MDDAYVDVVIGHIIPTSAPHSRGERRVYNWLQNVGDPRHELRNLPNRVRITSAPALATTSLEPGVIKRTALDLASLQLCMPFALTVYGAVPRMRNYTLVYDMYLILLLPNVNVPCTA